MIYVVRAANKGLSDVRSVHADVAESLHGAAAVVNVRMRRFLHKRVLRQNKSLYSAAGTLNMADLAERIKEVEKITKDDIINVSKKVNIHTMFLLEANDEKNNSFDDFGWLRHQ